jgi:hypothetical protein
MVENLMICENWEEIKIKYPQIIDNLNNPKYLKQIIIEYLEKLPKKDVEIDIVNAQIIILNLIEAFNKK